MHKALHLKILSPDDIVFDGVIKSIHLCAAMGEVEIFSNHTAYISSLLPGYAVIRHASDKSDDRYFIDSGYVKVNNNEVLLVVDAVLSPSDVNKTYFQNQVALYSENIDQIKDDHVYEKTINSAALYQQYSQ